MATEDPSELTNLVCGYQSAPYISGSSRFWQARYPGHPWNVYATGRHQPGQESRGTDARSICPKTGGRRADASGLEACVSTPNQPAIL